MGKSWWHLQASGQEQRSASGGTEGIRGYSQTDQPCLLWDTQDSRDGKEMQLSLLMLNVGGISKDAGVGKMGQHPLGRGSPECALCLHSFCVRLTNRDCLSIEPLFLVCRFRRTG